MGVLVHAGILKDDKTLTDQAKADYIREVKELLVYGSENLPTPVPFPCGDPMPPPNPPLRMEDFPLEDEIIYESFHRDFIKNQYEKTVASMDVEPSFSLLPMLADPAALAGSFGVTLPEIPFPDGFIPYLTGLLVPKFLLDLFKAGVTDFLLPIALVPELLKLISVPTPPVIPPLPPIELPPLLPPTAIPIPPVPPIPSTPPVSLAAVVPGLPEAPIPEIPPLPPIPPVPIPVPPVVALADVYLKDLALLEGVPKLIGEIIAEIPKLISKLANVSELFSFICGKVRDSGMLGQSAPENDLEKAASIVLSRKISECIFYVAVGKTLGSAKGSSIVAGTAKKLGNNVPPPDASTKPVQKKPPSQVVEEYARYIGSVNANGSYGLSYGGAPSLYVETLLYLESFLGTVKPGTINVFGEPLGETIPIPEGTTREIIKRSPQLQKELGVTQPRGFSVLADYSAKDYSSCAMFGRACYFRAGAINKFFMGLYRDASAVQGLMNVGLLRNYSWVKSDGTPTGLGDIANSVEDYLDWQLREVDEKGDASPSPNVLKNYRKPKDKRAVIDTYELAHIARSTGGKFPALRTGDMFLVALVNEAGGQSNQHLAVVLQDYPEIQFPTTESQLSTSVLTVDGGQMDDLNLGPPTKTGKVQKFIKEEELKGTNVTGGKQIDDAYFDGTYFVTRDEGKKIFGISRRTPLSAPQPGGSTTQYADNYLLTELTDKFLVKKPTAILPGRYDVGYANSSDGIKAGFYLGKSMIYSSQAGVTFGQEGSGKAFGENGIRKVVMIFKTSNYLDPFENGDVDDPDIASSVYQNMIKKIDEHPAVRETYGVVQGFHLDALIQECFLSLPSGKTKPATKP